jgi:hypothetical protein
MIDYARLDRSIQHYSIYNFQRIESPWTVTKAVADITKPPNAKDWEIQGKDKVLVASGEQSFLYLYLKDFLPKGRFQTITPCFRDEPFDLIHTKYFIKNELIITDDVNLKSLSNVIGICRTFFQEELGDKVEIVDNSNGVDTTFDLVYNGTELGSYGIRSCGYLTWIYATGLAEPRMSFIKSMNHGLSQK